MRALSLIAAALCGLVFTACYDHSDTFSPEPQPVAQAGDGPMLDRVEGEQGPVTFDHAGHMGYGFACTDCHHTVAPGKYPTEGCVDCHPVPADEDPAHAGPDDNMVLVGDAQDTAELPGVPFNHYTHSSDHGYKLACTSCHKGGNIPCSTCHGELAKQQGSVVLPKLKRAMHLQCLGCHESLVGSNPSSIAPVDCDTCHSEREIERLEGSLSFERASHLSCVSCHRDVKAERAAAPVSCAGCHVPPADIEAYETALAEAAAAEAAAAAATAELCETEECVAEGEEAPADGEDAAQAGSGGPADVTWECANGLVTFRHSTHQVQGCEGCHPDPYAMAHNPMGQEAGHAACAKCHAEQVTADCVKCHVP